MSDVLLGTSHHRHNEPIGDEDGSYDIGLDPPTQHLDHRNVYSSEDDAAFSGSTGQDTSGYYDPVMGLSYEEHWQPRHRTCLERCRCLKSTKCRLITYAVVLLAVVGICVAIIIVLSNRDDSSSVLVIPDFSKDFRARVSAVELAHETAHWTNISRTAGWSENDSKRQAEAVCARMQAHGIPKTMIKTYRVFTPFPTQRNLTLLDAHGGVAFTAALREPNIAQDPDTASAHPPPVLLYSAAGTVQNASVVYVNYCRMRDFKALAEAWGGGADRVNLQRSIVLCRWGGQITAARKFQFAARFNAGGVLFYSDPQQGGITQAHASGSSVYPHGPWRPAGGTQSGSVYAGEGDPMTPGFASTQYAQPLTPAQRAKMNAWFPPLPEIPSLPLSWADAEPILRALRGHSVPAGDAGGGNFTYHYGRIEGAEGRVNMHVATTMQSRRIHNCLGAVPGLVEPDRHVMLGARRDALAGFGAAGSAVATAMLLEVARAVGQLRSTRGYGPARTLTFCSWDAHAYGLSGAMELAEELHSTLHLHGVAYLSMDVVSSGSASVFAVRGVPSLQQLVRKVTADIIVPQELRGSHTQTHNTHTQASLFDGESQASSSAADSESFGTATTTLFDMWTASQPERALPVLTVDNHVYGAGQLTAENNYTTSNRVTRGINELAFQSDLEAFLHFLGIPSVTFVVSGAASANVDHFASTEVRSSNDKGNNDTFDLWYSSVHNSLYDTSRWLSMFGGGGQVQQPQTTSAAFMLQALGAKFWGSLAMHISDAQVIPFFYTGYVHKMQEATAQLKSRFQGNRTHTAWNALDNALTEWERVAKLVDSDKIRQLVIVNADIPSFARRINDILQFGERQFIMWNGVYGQPSPTHRHVLWGRSALTGFTAPTFTALYDLITAQELGLSLHGRNTTFGAPPDDSEVYRMVGIIASAVSNCATWLSQIVEAQVIG